VVLFLLVVDRPQQVVVAVCSYASVLVLVAAARRVEVQCLCVLAVWAIRTTALRCRVLVRRLMAPVVTSVCKLVLARPVLEAVCH
jgi:hypothetical protein